MKRLLTILSIFIVLTGCDTGDSYKFINKSSYPVSFKIFENSDTVTVNPNDLYDSPYDIARGINGFKNSFRSTPPWVYYVFEESNSVVFYDTIPKQIAIQNMTALDVTITEKNGYLDGDKTIEAGKDDRGLLYTDKPVFEIVGSEYIFKIDFQIVKNSMYVTIH